MDVPRNELPDWDDIQLLTAQLFKPPLPDDELVGTDIVIGPNAQKPLKLKIPQFASMFAWNPEADFWVRG